MPSIDLAPSQETAGKAFWRSQVTTKPQAPPSTLSLSRQTGIITGSNSGLGLECARVMLSYGLSRLILAVRSTSKGAAIATELRKQYPKASIEVWALDMFSYDYIQAFAKRCESLDTIDFVILNAGMGGVRFKLNESTKHEEIVQVNYISTALLTILLLPVLKEKRPSDKVGRLTIVSSVLGHFANLKDLTADPFLSTFDDPKKFKATERYAESKLLGQMFVFKLQEFVSADDVIVNLVEPGMMKPTALDRQMPTLAKPLMLLFRKTLGRDLEAGAWTYIDAAVVKGPASHMSFCYNWEIYP